MIAFSIYLLQCLAITIDNKLKLANLILNLLHHEGIFDNKLIINGRYFFKLHNGLQYKIRCDASFFFLNLLTHVSFGHHFCQY